MKFFVPKLIPVAVASIVCGIAMAGGDKGAMKMDTDGDGEVSATEHSNAAKQMFTQMDADHDGNVTAKEMDAAHAAMMKNRTGDAAANADKSYDKAAKEHAGKWMSSSEKIASMDTNGDGKLSATEHAAGAQQRFSKMDADGDGVLTAQELRKSESMMTASDTE